MAEKPILFSGEMVRAILDGRKTQTRRVIKDLPENFPGGIRGDVSLKEVGEFWCLPTSRGYKKMPYGKPGDLLWVRETFQWCSICGTTNFRANSDGMCWQCSEDLGKWQPSIFMPREASRLTLRVVGVRVERVQDIEPKDCIAEGIENFGSFPSATMYREWFQQLWDSINAKRGYSWDSNPWVWVVEFEAVTP